MLFSAAGDTGVPAPSLWSPAPGTACPHVPPLVTTDSAGDKQVSLAGMWEGQSAFLGDAFPGNALPTNCCSPSVGLSPFPVADRNQTPHFAVDSIHQQPAAAAGI